MDGRIVRCASCGQANRVPDLSTGKKAVCGKCKAPLTRGGVVELTDSTFAAAIAKGAHVVDFWAAWCGPCRILSPVIEDLASSRDGVAFGKIDVDANPQTSARFKVSSIPTLIFFRDGVEITRSVGAVPKSQIERLIAEHLS